MRNDTTRRMMGIQDDRNPPASPLRVIHLNGGTLWSRGAGPAARTQAPSAAYRLASHCVALVTEESVTLVDTGIGLLDLAAPEARLGKDFLRFAYPELKPEETVARQLQTMGIASTRVRHIVLTHLHVDHVGGLADFPQAAVHVGEVAYQAAMHPDTPIERRQYQPAQWAHGPQWARHADFSCDWYGLAATGPLSRLPAEVRLVALPGHSRGHCGVAIATGAGWLLHAGDAYIHRGQIDPACGPCPPLLANVETAVQVDRAAVMRTHEALQRLVRDHAETSTVFCAHDPAELERCQSART